MPSGVLNLFQSCTICACFWMMVLWAPWSDSNPSCLVQNLWESRVFLNRSFCVLEKTPILLGNYSILPKPWSDSSIPSVDMFTSTLWSCLQILSLFGRVLIAKSSSFPKNAGWKKRLWTRTEFFPAPVEPMFWKYPSRINRWVVLSRVRGFGVFCGCTGASDSTCIGSTGVTTGFVVLPVQPTYSIF